jgi:hypothetical protein
MASKMFGRRAGLVQGTDYSGRAALGTGSTTLVIAGDAELGGDFRESEKPLVRN